MQQKERKAKRESGDSAERDSKARRVPKAQGAKRHSETKRKRKRRERVVQEAEKSRSRERSRDVQKQTDPGMEEWGANRAQR